MDGKYFIWMWFLLDLQNYQASRFHRATTRQLEICQRHTEVQRSALYLAAKTSYQWLIITNTKSGVWEAITPCHPNYNSHSTCEQEGQYPVFGAHWKKLFTVLMNMWTFKISSWCCLIFILFSNLYPCISSKSSFNFHYSRKMANPYQ